MLPSFKEFDAGARSAARKSQSRKKAGSNYQMAGRETKPGPDGGVELGFGGGGALLEPDPLDEEL